jgi:hypothetical protein
MTLNKAIFVAKVQGVSCKLGWKNDACILSICPDPSKRKTNNYKHSKPKLLAIQFAQNTYSSLYHSTQLLLPRPLLIRMPMYILQILIEIPRNLDRMLNMIPGQRLLLI